MKKPSLLFTAVFCLAIPMSLSADENAYTIIAGEKLVMENTYGKTYWDNLVDRGTKLYLKPVYGNDFKDTIRFITLPELKKIEIDVPLESFFNNNKNLLAGGTLHSTLKNGKERKNYWIEDCFFYDTQNKEAGLRVMNYFLQAGGSVQRTIYVHWDLSTNKITGVVQLMEYERKIQKGEYHYTAESIETVGYNQNEKKLYYLKIEDFIKVVKDGKYSKYLRTKNLSCSFYKIERTSNQKIVSLEIGSIDTPGKYNQKLNTYFLPGYKDLADEIDKKYPEGFIVNLGTGDLIKIPVQPHAYWADFDAASITLFHISSSTGKLAVFDIKTGLQTGTLQLGDAGDDRYMKFRIPDKYTALYYIQGKLILIDIINLKIKKTINLAARFKEFSASSPACILPDGNGIIIEARDEHNKTTGYLYLLKN